MQSKIRGHTGQKDSLASLGSELLLEVMLGYLEMEANEC